MYFTHCVLALIGKVGAPREPPQPVERSDRRPGARGCRWAGFVRRVRRAAVDSAAQAEAGRWRDRQARAPGRSATTAMLRRDCTHRPVAFRAARSAERRVSNAQRRVQPADPHARQLGAQHVQKQHTHVQLGRAMQRMACVRARACGESTGGACVLAPACSRAFGRSEERARIWPNQSGI